MTKIDAEEKAKREKYNKSTLKVWVSDYTDRIKAEAKKDDVSVSKWVFRLIKKYFEEQDRK